MSIGYGYGNPKTGGLSRLRQRLRPSSFSDARCTWMIRIAGNSPHPRSCPALLRTGLVSACLLRWPHHKRQAFARCARLQDLGSVYTNAGLPASAHALPSWFPRPRNAETTRGDTGKERVDGSLRSHRPSSQSFFWLDRRVNSAIRERGLRRSATRNYSAPVVTHCSIDPSTFPHAPVSRALRLRSAFR